MDLAKPKSEAPLLFFLWPLLICENTLIQVIKLKKKKEKRENSHPCWK